MNYKNLFVETRFGRTHILQAGRGDSRPILLFHGGNSTAPYSIKQNLHLIKDFLVYAPDTIGHPGKSDQKVLSSNSFEYGEWASDVISSPGFEKIICFGESFGGGILAKLMCIAPEKISRAILLVPAGIFNASKTKLIFSMGIPMMMYILTGKEKWFEKTFYPMKTHNEPIDKDTIEMMRASFHHVKINPNMPSIIKKEDIKNFQAPTLLLAGEKDVLFPGKKVIERAEKIFPNVETHLLENCGHLYFSSDERREHIRKLIMEFLSEK